MKKAAAENDASLAAEESPEAMIQNVQKMLEKEKSKKEKKKNFIIQLIYLTQPLLKILKSHG